MPDRCRPVVEMVEGLRAAFVERFPPPGKVRPDVEVAAAG
jgi:hypothetical protein